ncbi:phosphotransferase family protein [Streptomyces sp. NBC_00690]|uniref:phosphotransferase family protein n=1 Tax=Streptomyces sp. NBC_00690 TaxID=2975808 RepID=UPI002E2CD248|nr:phosphotransferase [Streptomyces sp. NBC_00690]
MTGSPVPTIRHLIERIAAGDADALDGRGVNMSHRIVAGEQRLSVKVHCAERSSGPELQRIRSVDAELRGTAWYPPVIDIGFDGGKRPRLVVVRPFVPGEPADDARRHIDPLFSVLADLAGSTGRTEIHQDLIADYASPWLTPGERELTVAALAGDRRGLVRAMDDHLDDLRASALRLTRPGEAMIYHGDLHGRNLLTDGSGSPTVIDWDETGYSQRPADAGKALWLSCRRGRGDFELDPSAARRFVEHLWRRLGIPPAQVGDVAKLGAIWFLPRSDHVALLAERDVELVPWYLDWVSRFWSRFEVNVELLLRTAEELDARGSAVEGERS